MSNLFKKSSVLDKKLKRIEKDLSLLNSEMKTLSRFVEKPEKSVNITKLKPPVKAPEIKSKSELPRENPKYGSQGKKAEAQQTPPAKDPTKVYEERFADYLASSFQTVQVLRRERSIQRNKALIMLLFIFVLVVLLLYHWLG